MTQKDFGNTKEGFPIVARACAEDNSGVVYAHPNGTFVVRLSFPVYVSDDGESNTIPFASKAEAIQALKDYTGIARLERDGPGF